VKDKEMMRKAGERLREVRTIMGLSQEALGDLLGIARESINYREAGRFEIRADLAAKVVEIARDRGIDWLTGDYLLGISDQVAVPGTSLNDLVQKAHENAVAKGFWNNPPELGTAIALIHGELSEALEEARTGHEPDEMYYGKNGKPEGVPSELADAVIRIFDVCGYYGINLEAAITQKMAFNTTRPKLHGKKF